MTASLILRCLLANPKTAQNTPFLFLALYSTSPPSPSPHGEGEEGDEVKRRLSHRSVTGERKNTCHGVKIARETRTMAIQLEREKSGERERPRLTVFPSYRL